MKNKLQLTLGAPNEIIFERDFDAPRHLVYKAMTDAELLKRWMGNSCSPMIEAESDLPYAGLQMLLRPLFFTSIGLLLVSGL